MTRAVCLLVDSLRYAAGTEHQVLETARRMARDRFNVHVCCLEDSSQLRELASNCHIAVFPVRRLYSPSAIRQLLRFRRYLNQHHIEIMQAFMVKTDIFGVLAARGSRCRIIITSRLNSGYWYTRLNLHVFRYLNRYTTRIMANSHRAKASAVETEGLPPEKVDVVYQGVDVARYAGGSPEAAGSLGIPSHAKVVGMVANFRPVKDIPLFLRAAAIVSTRIPEAVFLLVGKGPRADLVHLAGELGITDKVYFADEQATVPDYLRRMSVGCLSSLNEGFANAILEYMAASLPVVATDVGGNGEAIEHGMTGYLVREHTPEAFAAPIIELLSDEERRCAMGRRSFERCRNHFDIHTTIRELEDYYLALLEAEQA